ncbi:MAG: hypothetical protein ABIH49_01475 [archaeon]
MELALNQIIKIILGILVIVAVIAGLYFFGSQITSFFKNLPGGNLLALLLK